MTLKFSALSSAQQLVVIALADGQRVPPQSVTVTTLIARGWIEAHPRGLCLTPAGRAGFEHWHVWHKGGLPPQKRVQHQGKQVSQRYLDKLRAAQIEAQRVLQGRT